MIFKGKTVLITGAAGGYGTRLTQAFHEEGAHLILHGRNIAPLEALKATLPAVASQKIALFDRDLKDQTFSSALKQAIEHAGGVDVVVNNAAEQGPIGRTWEVDPAAWAQTIEIDLILPASICQIAIPFMIKKGGGKIVNISGGGATGTRPNFSAYAAAKTAIARFSECLADEAREFKIDVNAIAPGVMPTRMYSGPITEADPFAEPVALCLYLASPQSNGVSGKLISAIWDKWRTLHEAPIPADTYTLKRIIPPTVPA